MLVRQRIRKIGREAADRIREEMRTLGQKISETKEKGSQVGEARDQEGGKSWKPTKQPEV